MGADQARRNDWIIPLKRNQIEELGRAAQYFRRRGLQLDTARPKDFNLPKLEPLVRHIQDELRHGRGFVLLRGLNVDEYTLDELELIFWGIGVYLGVGVSQSAAGDRLGHVTDRGSTDRYYTAGGKIEFHMDPVDVVGLMCVRPAKAGGQSRIVSSSAIHNVILEERPDVLEFLYRGFFCSRQGHGEPRTDWRVPVFAFGTEGLESYFLPITIRQAAKEGAPLSDAEREAIEVLQEVAGRDRVCLHMDFQPGDIQFLNNRLIFHARGDYRDHENPALKRLLLRLWLMMPGWPCRDPAMDLHRRTDRAGGGVQSD
jgi:Taurine catabolism dioxygenase TauD, TfdA family